MSGGEGETSQLLPLSSKDFSHPNYLLKVAILLLTKDMVKERIVCEVGF